MSANEHKRFPKQLAIILCILVAVVLGTTLLVTQVIIPDSRYASAEKQLSEGNYAEALDAFTQLNHYKNSDGMVQTIRGMQALSTGDPNEAVASILAGNVPVEVRFDTAGGNEMAPITYADAAGFTGLPEATRHGHRFNGWLAQGIYAEGKVTLSLQAAWDDHFLLRYELDGGTNAAENPADYTMDDQVVLEDPVKEGYIFRGWYSDSDFQNKVSYILRGTQKNMTLYAKWEIITCTITYELDGGTIPGGQKTTFTIHDLPLKLPEAQKEDMDFLHWGTGHRDGLPISEITSLQDVTVAACFKDLDLVLKFGDPEQTYYVVSLYDGKAKHVDVPAYYKGLPVKEIGRDAFRQISSIDAAPIKSIHLPDTIVKIGESAFYYCSNLLSINLPESLRVIDKHGFYGCRDLPAIELPSNLQYIGAAAFAYCGQLTEITIPDSVTFLGTGAFDGCHNLKTVTLGNGITTLPALCFRSCGDLRDIYIPDSVTTIERAAFYHCYNLPAVTLPKSVTQISGIPFESCSKLTIFCRAEEAPEGFGDHWNGKCPVVWGYVDDSIVYNFVVNGGSEIADLTAPLIRELPVTKKEGYALFGWYDNPQFQGDPVTFPYYSDSKRTLYARWMEEGEYYNGTSKERVFRLGCGDSITITFDEEGQQFFCSITPAETGTYTITGKTFDHYFVIYDSGWSGLKSSSPYDRKKDGRIFLSLELTAGETYYIIATCRWADDPNPGPITITIQ